MWFVHTPDLSTSAVQERHTDNSFTIISIIYNTFTKLKLSGDIIYFRILMYGGEL